MLTLTVTHKTKLIRHCGSSGMSLLTPTQEHYLKRELLKLEIEAELLQFNDGLALRRFGYPFTSTDPAKSKRKAIELDSTPKIEGFDEFPLTKHFFDKFILTIPFLSQDHQNYDEFWVQKVQLFYEKFMAMNMSESMDREESTKRKKMGRKISKLFLMVYNSGIGTTNELIYYSNDKKVEVGESTHQSKRLEKLLLPSKDSLTEYVAKGKFINGLNVNVSGVRFVTKSNNNKFWNNLSHNLALTKNHESYFEFLIKTKADLPDSEEVFVARRYGEFRELHRRLKSIFPGKKLPSLPSKVKADISFGGDEEVEEHDEEDSGVSDDEEAEEEEEKDNEIRKQMSNLLSDLKNEVSPKSPKLPQEALKTPTSPKSPKSQNFFKTGKIQWGYLAGKKDHHEHKTASHNANSNIASNLPREKTRVGLRAYLKGLQEDIEISHSDCFKEFLYKGKIARLSDEEKKDIKLRENLDLILLLNQIKFQGETWEKINTLKQSSLPLRSKLLETDNGILEIFDEFEKKEHVSQLSSMLRDFMNWCKIEIAATIYQLFLGNDNSYEFYSQVKRIHKLMPYSIMINILKYTNPMGIMKAMIDLLMASPFGGKSLLQTLFYGILSEDMKSQGKVISKLEEKIGNEQIIQRLKFFVYDCDDYNLIQIIKEESKDLSVDTLLSVIITPHLSELSQIDDDTIGTVFESYNEYKKLNNCKPEDAVFINQEKTAFYSNLRELYKLYVKNHDKEILQLIWSQPELTLILKDLFTMFYQPLVNLLKNARVDVAFRNFQRFMDDLVELLDRLSMDIYVNDPSKIVDDIMTCLNDHEDEFYQFLHEVYVKDKNQIFQKLVVWVNSILSFLRTSKDSSLKESERIDLNQIIRDNKDINQADLLKELNDIIESVKTRHAEYLKKKKEQESKKTKKDFIAHNWDELNNNMEIFKSEDFGLNKDDLEDLDDEEHDDHESSENGSVNQSDHMELKNLEIKKLLDHFKVQLASVLKENTHGICFST